MNSTLKLLEAFESLVEDFGYSDYISDEEKEQDGRIVAARALIAAAVAEAQVPDTQSIVSDQALAQAFAGTNFGTSEHRHLLHQAVLKKACGYHCGHTITTIMRELSLIGVSGLPTKKGRRLMQLAWRSQMLKGP